MKVVTGLAKKDSAEYNMLIREGLEMTKDDALLYDKYKGEAEYYDRIQYTYKIKLNSFYGALTNRFFRFFDSRMGESTTGTGRMILKHQCAHANQVLLNEYDDKGDAIVYGDTDSTYFHTFADKKEEAVKIADYVARKI